MIDLTAIRTAATEKGWRVTRRQRGANHYLTVLFQETPPRNTTEVIVFVCQFFNQAHMTSYGASTSATFKVGNIVEILKND